MDYLDVVKKEMLERDAAARAEWRANIAGKLSLGVILRFFSPKSKDDGLDKDEERGQDDTTHSTQL